MNFGVAFLAAETFDIDQGHAVDTKLGDGILDGVNLERFDDGLDFLHMNVGECVVVRGGLLAGDRQFRIGLGAVFMDIEPDRFTLRGDAQSARGFHQQHEDHGHDEDTDANGQIPDELGDQLVGAATVE